MVWSNVILIVYGGMIFYVVVVVCGMGKCCIVGCVEFIINEKDKMIIFFIGDILYEGDVFFFDGSFGKVYFGEIVFREVKIGGYFDELMVWVDVEKRLMI